MMIESNDTTLVTNHHQQQITFYFFSVFNQSYLKKIIFEKIKEININSKSLKYGSIISFDWMLDTGYYNLLQEKIQRNEYVHFSLNPELIFTLKDIELFKLCFKRYYYYFPSSSTIVTSPSSVKSSKGINKQQYQQQNSSFPLLINSAAKYNNFDAIKYLADDSIHYPKSYRKSLNYQALIYITRRTGDQVLPMVKYMVETFDIAISEESLRNAVKNNNVELIKYLVPRFNHKKEVFNIDILLSLTFSYGDLNISRFLVEYYRVQTITESMLQSASNNASVFKYLLEQSNNSNNYQWMLKPSITIMLSDIQIESPSIIDNLMVSAVINGNLEIVQYIHSKKIINNLEKMIHSLAILSLSNGHIQVFEFIYNSIEKVPINHLFLSDIKNVTKHLDSTIHFYKTYGVQINPESLCLSLQASDSQIFNYLFSNGEFRIKDTKIFFNHKSMIEITHRVVKECSSCYNLEVLQFLYSQGVKHTSNITMGEINWKELGSSDDNLPLIKVILQVCTPAKQHLLAIIEQAGYFGSFEIFKYIYLEHLKFKIIDSIELKTTMVLIISKKRRRFIQFLLDHLEKVPSILHSEIALLGFHDHLQENDINKQILVQAAVSGNLHIFKTLLSRINLHDIVATDDILASCVDYGHYECAMYLLEDLGIKPASTKVFLKGIKSKNYLVSQYFYQHHKEWGHTVPIQDIFDSFVLMGHLDSIIFYHQTLGATVTDYHIQTLINHQAYWVLEYFRDKINHDILSRIDPQQINDSFNETYSLYVNNYLVQYSPSLQMSNNDNNSNNNKKSKPKKVTCIIN